MKNQKHSDPSCPAANYEHKADMVMCYAYAYFDAKPGKPKECNVKAEYCVKHNSPA